MTPLVALLFASPAWALTLSLEWEDSPYEGLTVQAWRASSPSTDVYVARIDLCAGGVEVDATRPPSDYQSTGSWAAEVGAQLATNGDFYTSGPQIYGDAVGAGARWPLDQLGVEREGEWYYQDYGWIAFLHDGVTFTHTKWVKQNLAPTSGWAPDELAPDPPPGVLALVSGFPELVIEGEPVDCSSPTAEDCFPDRSDMRARHPRTAMGLTEDGQTFLLAVVDGRTSDNSGMYGEELAALMGELGAWVAFNLDGGGSSQMWLEGEGYLNDVDGNNYGSGTREVANHWGVFSAGSALRPAHCASEAPCDEIAAAGGIIDDGDACFGHYGRDEYWREEDAGYGGHLYWTKAWTSEYPDNWAWWRLELAEAGDYEVSVWLEPEFAAYHATRYEVMAAGTLHEVLLDQSTGEGWTSLGTFSFAAGGEQWVAVLDDYEEEMPDEREIAVDALSLARVGEWCGDGACGAEEGCACPEDCPVAEEIAGNGLDDDCDGETDEGAGGGDSASPDSGGAGGESGSPEQEPGTDEQEPPGTRIPADKAGCGCATAPPGGLGALALGALAGLLARRRPPQGRSAMQAASASATSSCPSGVQWPS